MPGDGALYGRQKRSLVNGPLQGGAKKNPNVQDGNSPGQQHHAFGQCEELDAPAVFRDAAPSQAVASSGVDSEAGEEVCPEGLRVLFLNVGKSCCFPLVDLGVPVVGELAEFFDAGLAVKGI